MKVVIAVDNSATAEHVLDVAAAFPLPEEVQAAVVSVCPVPDLHSMGSLIPAAVNEMVDHCRHEAEGVVERAKERLASRFPGVQTIVDSGHPAQTLLKVIGNEHAALVFLGARRLGTMDRLLLGSVSDRVVRHAHCSVVVVRPQTAHVRPNHILIAFDNSPGIRRAVEHLAAQDHPAGTHVRVVSVVPAPSPFRPDVLTPSSGIWEEELRHVQEGLNWAEDQLCEHVTAVTTAMHEADHVADDLLKAASDFGADLLVVGDTGKNALERFMLGSVSSQLLHRAQCSVWVSRPGTA
ncbi:MAG: universal stress protein [Planctomycetaceae bacterium]|nr:universal stress protein [Planctomycetaceae bacterium]